MELTPAMIEAIQKWEAENNSNDEYDFCDNHRFARVGNAEEEAAYDEAAESGCCGRCDVILETADGQIRYGFNYGH